MKMHLAMAALTVAIGSASFGAAAQNYFDKFENGTGSCQGALPNFEGNLRKRPLALQNEGTSVAFVTCSPQSFLDLYDETFGQRLLFINNGTTAATVTCTAVDMAFSDPPNYITKEVNVDPNGAFGRLDFTGADDFGYGSFSCALPPGTGIYGVASYSSAEYVPPAPTR